MSIMSPTLLPLSPLTHSFVELTTELITDGTIEPSTALSSLLCACCSFSSTTFPSEFTRLLPLVDFASDDTISVFTPFGVVVTLTNVVFGAGLVVVVVPPATKLISDDAIVIMLLAVVAASVLDGNVAITTDRVDVAAEFNEVAVTKFDDGSVEMALL